MPAPPFFLAFGFGQAAELVVTLASCGTSWLMVALTIFGLIPATQ
ncbi:MAG: hypothetical protein ACXWZ6_10425 [Solirubrobacterales bacterium]